VDDSDDIIDLAPYLRLRAEEEEDEDGGVFTFWGGDGERSRFALPLWRAAYMFNARRSALVWVPSGAPDAPPTPLTLLDLRSEEARLEFGTEGLVGLANETKAGTMAVGEEGLAIYLGEGDDRKWYIVVDDVGDPDDEASESERPLSDLLFLAGECAGLLFFRGLATDEHGWADEP
jgi:hypothetical protein